MSREEIEDMIENAIDSLRIEFRDLLADQERELRIEIDNLREELDNE